MRPTALALSPHLDDAASPAGGTLARLAEAAGASWWRPSSPPRCRTHGGSRSPASATRVSDRRSTTWRYAVDEDAVAMRALGAEPLWLPFREAPHRGYDSAPELFAGLRDDDRVVDALAPELRPCSWRSTVPLWCWHRKASAATPTTSRWCGRSTRAGVATPVLWWRDFPYAVRDASPREPLRIRMAALPEARVALSPARGRGQAAGPAAPMRAARLPVRGRRCTRCQSRGHGRVEEFRCAGDMPPVLKRWPLRRGAVLTSCRGYSVAKDLGVPSIDLHLSRVPAPPPIGALLLVSDGFQASWRSTSGPRGSPAPAAEAPLWPRRDPARCRGPQGFASAMRDYLAGAIDGPRRHPGRRRRHGLPAPRLGGAAHHPAGADALLRADRGRDRPAGRGPRGGPRQRPEPRQPRRSLPPRHRRRGRADRLRRRRGPQALAARPRAAPHGRRRARTAAVRAGDLKPSCCLYPLRASASARPRSSAKRPLASGPRNPATSTRFARATRSSRCVPNSTCSWRSSRTQERLKRHSARSPFGFTLASVSWIVVTSTSS